MADYGRVVVPREGATEPVPVAFPESGGGTLDGFSLLIPAEKAREHDWTPSEGGGLHVYCEACGVSCCDSELADKPCPGVFQF